MNTTEINTNRVKLISILKNSSENQENFRILCRLSESYEDSDECELGTVEFKMEKLVKIRNELRGIKEKTRVFVPPVLPTPKNEQEEIEQLEIIGKAKEKFNRYHSGKIHNCETLFNGYIHKHCYYSSNSLWVFQRNLFREDLKNYKRYQEEVVEPIKNTIINNAENDPDCSKKDIERAKIDAGMIQTVGDVENYNDSKITCNSCSILKRTIKSLNSEVLALRMELAILKEENEKKQQKIDSIISILK